MRFRQPWLIGLFIFAGGFTAGHWYAGEPGSTPSTAAQPARVAAPQQPDSADHSINTDDRRLRAQLLRANTELSHLAARNRALQQQIETMNLPLPVETTLPELMQRIDLLPAAVIRQQLELIFGRTYVDDIDDPHGLAKELIEIALEDEPEPEDRLQVNIGFSLSAALGLRAFGNLESIDKRDRVFAHFDPSLAYANLIVRWQHRETGEILLFEPLQIGSGQDNYRSLKPRNGWRTGVYTVSVFDLDDEQRLVGSNSYRIDAVTESEIAANDSGPDWELIEDLLSTGQAVPRTY